MLAPFKAPKQHWILTRLGTIALEFACYALIFIIVFVYIYRAFE
jgi:hypothetical protein